MQAFSEMTLEKAADYVANRVVLSSEIGFVKAAFSQPQDLAQALQWAFVPGSQPTIAPAPGATPIVDPGWGTINKAVLGAGIGLGGGALVSALDKKKRKNWLRNALIGGLLGGGIGGGLGAVAHYGNALSSPDATTADVVTMESLQGQIDDLLSRGEDVPQELIDARNAAAAKVPIPNWSVSSPLSDKAQEAAFQAGQGNLGTAAGVLLTSGPGAIAGATGGAAAGGLAGAANQHRIANLEANYEDAAKKFDAADPWARMRMMPDAEWQKHFGPDAARAKQELGAQQPVRQGEGVLKPVTTAEMFPDRPKAHGPTLPGQASVPSTDPIDVTLNDPAKSNAIMDSFNARPKKPIPKFTIGPKRGAGIGAVVGGIGGGVLGGGFTPYNAAAR